MRLLTLASILLLAQVTKKPDQPVQSSNPKTAAQEVQKQIGSLPASVNTPNSVSGALAAPISQTGQASTTNCCDNSNHLVTYANLMFAGFIALFTCLTWLVYMAMLRATKINERAWVVPNVGDIKPTTKADDFQVTVELRNNGKTPAWVTAAGSAGKGATKEKPLPNKPPYTEMKPFSKKGTLLSPSGSFLQGFPLTKDLLDHVREGKSQLFIFGYATYKDVYGDTHLVRYCFEAEKSLDASRPSHLEFYVNGPDGYIDAD